VLWVGVDSSPALIGLQQKVVGALDAAGLEGDRRRFSPHITIARFRNPVAQHVVAPFVAAHSLFVTPEFTVREFHLYSSVLARGGAVHTVEHSYPLLSPDGV
jgi:2'-5' RNA ligase